MRRWFMLFAAGFGCLCISGAAQADSVIAEGKVLQTNTQLTLEQEQGIGGLYLIFDKPYGSITLTSPGGGEGVVDTGGILHYYVDVASSFSGPPTRLNLCFSDGEAAVNALSVYAPGEMPADVQRWETIPEGEADLMVFSAHGDDEQLFFSGLLPWYGAELGKRVQVVYFTDHRNMTSSRVHEMLDGLWAVGIRDYPVFGSFEDYYTFDLQDAYRFYERQGHSEPVLVSFFTEQLRRWRPKVVVTHDEQGEYGHGMHQLCADLLKKAVDAAADPGCFPEQAARFGVWDVPKTYLHLYPRNPVVLNWDIPMESFDGKTAFEISRDLGFGAHKSQQKDFSWFYRGISRASEIPKFNPCFYGLYRSTVGEDVKKNDLFENLPEALEEAAPVWEQLETISQPAPQSIPAAEKIWPLYPAVGTLVLAVMTACCGNKKI